MSYLVGPTVNDPIMLYPVVASKIARPFPSTLLSGSAYAGCAVNEGDGSGMSNASDTWRPGDSVEGSVTRN